MAFKIVVVGGSGFIGTRLVRRLVAAGHSVVIADIARSAAFPECWKACDVTDPAALRECLAGAELVIHLAAVHRDDVRPVSLYQSVNVQGAENLCAAAEACGVQRILYVSSVAVYGPAGGPGAAGAAAPELDESAALRSDSEYGRSKAEAEGVFRAWFARSPGRTLTVIRPTTVFGEGNRGNVYNLMRLIERRRFLMIGSGRNIKSLAYVENVAAFLAFAVGFGPGEATLNYVDKPDLTMNELVVAVRQGLGRPATVGLRIPYFLAIVLGCLFDVAGWLRGRPLAVRAERMRKFVATTRYSAHKALASSFQAEVPLEEGLRRTVAFEFVAGKSVQPAKLEPTGPK